MKGFEFLMTLLMFSSLAQGHQRTLELSLGFPDAPGVRLVQSLGAGNLKLFVQGSAPFEILVKSYLPQKTLSKKDFFAIQNEPQDLNFRVQVRSLYGGGVEWYPFHGSFFLGTALEKRRLSIASDLSSGFRFITAEDSQLSRSELETSVRTRTEQNLLRLVMGQRLPLFTQWTFGWYCGATEVLHSQNRVQARVNLHNRQATLRSEAEADNLRDALAVQSEQLRDLASRELERIAGKRMPLLGLSLGLRF
jgi:hypothetical protein